MPQYGPVSTPTNEPGDRAGRQAPVPGELRAYLHELTSAVRGSIGDDLLGVWLIGSAAQGAYEHGVSDVDVLAVSGRRWSDVDRRRLGEQIVHPNLPCPAVGLEFVWYALPDLDPLDDPVRFQLNVNGGPARASAVQLEPDGGANYWSVLDLAGAARVGRPLVGPPADEVLPPVPPDRVRRAITESIGWHADADAGSPNRVLNLARLLLLAEENRWYSKLDGGARLRERHPEFAPAVDAALRARAQGSWLDPALVAPLHAFLLRAPS